MNWLSRCYLATLTLASLSAATSLAAAEPLVIDEKIHHLRGGGETREWLDFPETPEGDSLTVSFEVHAPNETAGSLWLRQRNVQWRWIVECNGKRLGTLREDEQGARIVYPVPPRTLKAGKNTLVVRHERGQRPDDIRIGDIQFEASPPHELLGARWITVRVTEAGTKTPLPCRLTLSDEHGDLVQTGNRTGKMNAVRPGVIYTLQGEVEIALPEPTKVYTLTASRGFEYGIAQATLDGSKEEWPETLHLELEKQVYFDGQGIDTHIHTLTRSRHGSCLLHERIHTMAGEGLRVGAATEHNLHVDYADMVDQLDAGAYVSTVVGNEYTTRTGHFNLLGVDPDAKPPGYVGTSWAGVRAGCRESGAKVVILNHARDVQTGYRPFDPANHDAARAERLDGKPYDFFHGMEVVNSGATQTDPFELMRDWFAMRNRGWQVGAIGSSDSHDVSRYIVGQARTYLKGPWSLERFAEALPKGETHLAYGLLTELELREGVPDITVHKPDWVTHEKTTLYRNGIAISAEDVETTGKQDFWLVAVAEGPGITAPHWPFARPYKPDGPSFAPRAIGISNVVHVDADGDGTFSSAFEYAERLKKSFEGEALGREAAGFDAAVRAFLE